MTSRQQVQEIPGALRVTREKARADYGTIVRKIRWGDGPVYVCGAGDCASLGLAAGYAFEVFLGWPVVARPLEVFQGYGLGLLQPRSVLLMISAKGEWPEAHELALTAQERGCTLIALTSTPDSPLVNLANHVFLSGAEGGTESPSVMVCLQAALNSLAFETMRVLKKPKAWWETVEQELDQLPDKLEWAFTQLSSVVRSTAAELAGLRRLRIVGGGFNHFPASWAARRLGGLAGLPVAASEASEFYTGLAQLARQEDAILFLSGSHSKIKKLAHRCAAQARRNGARVLCLTDGNDRELVDSSDLAVLIPLLLEAPASTLALFMLEWLAVEAVRAAAQPRASS